MASVGTSASTSASVIASATSVTSVLLWYVLAELEDRLMTAKSKHGNLKGRAQQRRAPDSIASASATSASTSASVASISTIPHATFAPRPPARQFRPSQPCSKRSLLDMVNSQSIDSTQSGATSNSQTPLTPVRGRSPGEREKSPGNDDLTASSPVRSRAKRAASSSPIEKGRSSRKRKRNADSASEIATALMSVAGSLKVFTSPEIRDRAVKQMEDDGDFSDDDGANIMMLFSEREAGTSMAQTYLASSKKDRRTAFLQRCLAKAEKEGRLSF
ncbi:hypothetical protein C8R45DRAFT_1207633 [Mycena sanguinolenta]|nr:hypothetical protein C8R45DRAFT_1207633 [Mycena sanguinolenta]